MAYEPIENYGVIGNMQSIALVGMNGSIDFLCYPDFDSPTIFAALLDDEKGGRFAIQPQLTNMRVRQLYLPETNNLVTRFLAEEGVVELIDCMPIDDDVDQPNEIVRLVKVIRGNVKFQMVCQPRFHYGASPHKLQISGRCANFMPDDNRVAPLWMHSTVDLTNESQDVTASFHLQAGQQATFLLAEKRPDEQPPQLDDVERRCLDTAHFWKA